MNPAHPLRTALKWTAGTVGFAASAYATNAGIAWVRYGYSEPPSAEEADALLDHSMPIYDLAERRHIAITAPADVTFIAACESDLTSCSTRICALVDYVQPIQHEP